MAMWNEGYWENVFLQNFLRATTIQDVLEVPAAGVYQASQTLKIPRIDENSVRVCPLTNTVIMNYEPDVLDSASASSITAARNIVITFDKMREFIHDFTFAIVTKSTNKKLKEVFPIMNEHEDIRTPDSIIDTPEAVLVLEYATTRNNVTAALKREYEVKVFRYKSSILSRVARSRTMDLPSKKYGLVPIVVSASQVVAGVSIGMSTGLVNELTARFRLASVLVDIAVRNGLKLAEDSFTQIQTDILTQVKNTEEAFQDPATPGVFVPLSKARVITTGIPEGSTYDKVGKLYSKCLMNSLDLVPRGLNDLDYSEMYKDYRESCLKSGAKRLSNKSVIQICGWLPPQCLDKAWVPEYSTFTDALTGFWNRMIILAGERGHLGEGMTEEEMIEQACQYVFAGEEDVYSTTRRLYKRVTTSLTNNERVEFGKVGVQGKSMKDNVAVKGYRLLHSTPFDPDVDTTDIDAFINRPRIPKSLGETTQSNIVVRSLLSRAISTTGSKNEIAEAVFDKALATDLAHWASFQSSITNELAVSLKQNVGHDEFIIKRLKDWCAYLVIKPTKSESHIFYTLVIPKQDKGSTQILPDGICKPMVENEKYMIMDWVSTSTSKLVNHIKTESFYLTMLSQWSRYYSLTLEDGMEDERVWKMVYLCMLIHLEDKPRTEEILTLFRYISMEKFSLVKTNNKKMLEKLPTVLWSRLQAWSVKKLLQAMADPNYDPETKEVLGKGPTPRLDRRWANMVNPFTREPVEFPNMLIELYYLGYTTNKEAKTWANTEFELIEKIVKYEKELAKVRPNYCGLEEAPDDYKFHEWSRDAVCAAADNLRRHYRNLYSDNFESKLEQKILYRLSRLTWEEVATLKASSTFNPRENYLDPSSKKIRITPSRVKVIVAILQNKDLLSDTPATSMSRVLDWVDKDGGLRVDIFKKNQHGGLREIYVLDIRSRLIQLFVEEIARAVSEDLPNEMMMHPESKLSRPQEHMYNSAKSSYKFKANVSSSNDAKVWNQGHHVAKFAQLMCRVLPSHWTNILVKTLKQWTFKRILMPEGVLSFLKLNSDTPMFNKVQDEIRKVWRGESQAHWLKSRSNYLKIESGMMQGILHYMSSLFHSAMLMLRDALWRVFCKQASIVSKSTDQVSSDDSGRMTDVFASTPESLKRAKILARADHIAIIKFSNYFGIWMSPKSTIASNGVYEFNSEFIIRASVYRPTLKWAYAALGVVETESLTERQEVFYNQITELLEGGSGFRQAYETQLAQGLLHYRLMGSTMHRLFNRYAIELSQNTDPALGFFMVDHHLAAGLSGYQYNLWRNISVNRVVNTQYAHMLRTGNLTTTTSGQLTRGAQVRFGDRKKARKLIEECEKHEPNWRRIVEDDPCILYTVARDMKTSIIKMLVKLTSPSVIQSLASGNALSRLLASGVYLISGMATTVGSNWQELLSMDLELGVGKPDSTSRKIKKTSLWNLVTMRALATAPLTREEYIALFPHYDHYNHLLRLFESLESYTLAHVGTYKKLRSHVQVLPEPAVVPFTLESMIKWAWCGDSLAASKTMLQEIWDNYKKIYPWLKDTPQMTLLGTEEQPSMFESHIQLRNFIARQSIRPRMVHLTGAPIRDNPTHDLVYTVIVRNQLQGHTLTESKDVVSPRREKSGDALQGVIAGLCSFPLTKFKLSELVKAALLDYDTIWEGTLSRPSPRKVRLGVIQSYLKLVQRSDLSSRQKTIQIKEIINRSRLGVMGGFTIVQKREDGEWIGEGIWTGIVGDASVEIHMTGPTLNLIITDNGSKLREAESLLRSLLKEFNISDHKRDSKSSDRLYFDLKSIRTDCIGAPVRINDRVRAVIELDFDSMSLRVDSDAIRLQHKVSRPLMSNVNLEYEWYTLTAYHPQTYDFRFTTSNRTDVKMLMPWLNNYSLGAQAAEAMLATGMTDRPGANVDMVAFKTFVKDSLLPSLSRQGWRFNSLRLFEAQSLMEEDDLLADIADMAGFDMVGDFGDFQSFDLDAPIDITDDDSTLVEHDFHDFVLGDVTFNETFKSCGNLRQIHMYWDNYSRHLFDTILPHDRALLESFKKNSRVENVARLLTFYFDWTFTEAPEMPRMSIEEEEELAKVMQEFM